MLTRKEFSDLLMNAWYNNEAGDWARTLAEKIQDQLEQEVVDEKNR